MNTAIMIVHKLTCFVAMMMVMINSSDAWMTTNNNQVRTSQITNLHMGLMDMAKSLFLQDREGDFVKLNDSSNIGGGPVLLAYKIPNGIDKDEVMDMLSDGAPEAFQQGLVVRKITTSTDPLMELTLQDALQQVLDESKSPPQATTKVSEFQIMSSNNRCPVLLFSGFQNSEMMASYNILAEEIYEEDRSMAACAKAVPNALLKPLSQVLQEISGDHQDALQMKNDDEPTTTE